MHESDVEAVANIHSKAFSRQKSSLAWINCNFAAFPRIQIFVARDEQDNVIGYIQWTQRSGFRTESVVELEQIAVATDYQRHGVGALLIKSSLQMLKDYLADSQSILKTVIVSTRANNGAKTLYESVLGAKTVATIDDLYSGDEMIMLANCV